MATATAMPDPEDDGSRRPHFDPLPFDKIEPNTPMVISVFSPSGGVGKSSISINLAQFIASAAGKKTTGWRPRVLLVDGDITHGCIQLRLGYECQHPTVEELLLYLDQRDAEGARGKERWPGSYDKAPEGQKSMKDFVLGEKTEFDFLAAPENPYDFFGVGAAECEEILALLGQFYDVIVIDSGTEIVMPHVRAWLTHAHLVVVPTTAEIDRLHNALKAIRLMTDPWPDPLKPHKMVPPLVEVSDVAVICNLVGSEQTMPRSFVGTPTEQEFIQQVKGLVDLEEYLAHYCDLELVRPEGDRVWSACCPFHAEDTPSFKVSEGSDGSKSWRCYGACNISGDVISAVMLKEGITALDAAYWLDVKFNLGLSHASGPDILKAVADTVKERGVQNFFLLPDTRPTIGLSAEKEALVQAEQTLAALSHLALSSYQRSAGRARPERLDDFQAEMGRWINKHGSEHLRHAHQDGFPVVQLYVEERARREFPGFIVGRRVNEVSLATRANPSPAGYKLRNDTEAQVEALGEPYRVTLAWQRESRGTNIGTTTLTPGEVVVIDDYLGHPGEGYALYQSVCVDWRCLRRFTKRLAAMARANADMTDTLGALAETESDPSFKAALEDIYSGCRQGKDKLSDALEKHPRFFDRFYVLTVRQAEATAEERPGPRLRLAADVLEALLV